MDSVNDLSGVFKMSDVWGKIDPAFINAIYSEKSDETARDLELEEKIRTTALSQLIIQIGKRKMSLARRFGRYALMAAVIVLAIGISWLLQHMSIQNTNPTAATNSTGAAETYATIVWPIKLEEYLDFNLNNVKSISIKHFNENWENDKTVFINDPSIIKQISDLVSQITLEIAPALAIQSSQNEVYEVAFYDKDQQPEPVEPYKFLSFRSTTDRKNYFVEGSFMSSMKLSPMDHLFQTNKRISFKNFEQIFDSLLD